MIKGYFEFECLTNECTQKVKHPFKAKELWEVTRLKNILTQASNIKNLNIVFKGSS